MSATRKSIAGLEPSLPLPIAADENLQAAAQAAAAATTAVPDRYSLRHLPLELFGNILSYLPGAASQNNFGLTCRANHARLTNALTTVVVDAEDEPLSEILEPACPRTLKITKENHAKVLHTIANTKHLANVIRTHLDLNRVLLDKKTLLARLITACPHLQEIYVDNNCTKFPQP